MDVGEKAHLQVGTTYWTEKRLSMDARLCASALVGSPRSSAITGDRTLIVYGMMSFQTFCSPDARMRRKYREYGNTYMGDWSQARSGWKSSIKLRIERDEFATPRRRVHPPRLWPWRAEHHTSPLRIRQIRWSSVPRGRPVRRRFSWSRNRPLDRCVKCRHHYCSIYCRPRPCQVRPRGHRL